MSKANSSTLDTYNKNVQQYIDGTVQVTSGFQGKWIDGLLTDLPKNASILEIGSAFGRDATYIREQGYVPDVTDASVGFVEYLRQHGFEANWLNIVEQQPTKQYDLILACAVFLHFTDEDFTSALTNVRSGLKSDGRFAFSLKQGKGDEWSETKLGAQRYFRYWQKFDVETALINADMNIVDFQTTEDGKWIHVVAEKEMRDEN